MQIPRAAYAVYLDPSCPTMVSPMNKYKLNSPISRAVVLLDSNGYSAAMIAAGLDYALAHDAECLSDIMSLSLSRILYSDAQLSDGARFDWDETVYGADVYAP